MFDGVSQQRGFEADNEFLELISASCYKKKLRSEGRIARTDCIAFSFIKLVK